MKNSNLTICNETIHPGETVSLALPLPELFSCAPMYMPIKVIHGKQKGPCLLVIAAMNGNALNGTEIIHRLAYQSRMKRLKGTLITVPVFNVYGFVHQVQGLPDNDDLDESFPGSPQGTHAQRMVYTFTQEILALADYMIELKTGALNYTNFPQVLIDFLDDREKTLSLAFSAPIISNVKALSGSLSETARRLGKPYLIYEAGEAMRLDEHAIRIGCRSITNVMRQLEMIAPSLKNNKSLKSLFVDHSVWLHSPTSGISHSSVKLGRQVKEGEQMCVIRDPFGQGDDVDLLAPTNSIVVAKNNLPLVREGEALFQLANFVDMEQAVPHLADWKSQSETVQDQEMRE